nr:mitochondria fission 1 protein [Cryptococcus tetragattii IND107]
MPTDLPYAAEAESSLSPDELEVLRRQYYKEIEQGHVTIQSKFNYDAQLMISSEIYSASPDHRRECTYYIAVGYYKLRNYAYARKFNNLLLSVEPGNMQAQSLSTLIENAVKRDGLIVLAVPSGISLI